MDNGFLTFREMKGWAGDAAVEGDFLNRIARNVYRFTGDGQVIFLRPCLRRGKDQKNKQ
jgi:hypothetical protein